jgi:hypothetical protein
VAVEILQVLPRLVDDLPMGSLVTSVMMVSGGLAVVARCLESSGGPIWAIPSLVFFLGAGIACVGMFLFARAVARRSKGESLGLLPCTIVTAFDPWSSDAARRPLAHGPRVGASDPGEMPGFSLSRDQVREAARLILFAGQDDIEKGARARRAERSACRRGHSRGPTPPAHPKRRRVRARPRLFM